MTFAQSLLQYILLLVTLSQLSVNKTDPQSLSEGLLSLLGFDLMEANFSQFLNDPSRRYIDVCVCMWTMDQ